MQWVIKELSLNILLDDLVASSSQPNVFKYKKKIG